MYRDMSIAVVMPAFNAADHLRQAVLSIPAFVDRIYVIDDGSEDGSGEIIADIERSGLIVIRHEQNRGVGAAIGTGYAAAMQGDADVVAVMAGDGQMDPADLPRLLDPVVTGRADHAKGNRFRHPAVWRTMPKLRIVGNVLLSLLTKVTSGYHPLFDSQCGYTATSRETLIALNGRIYPRYGYLNDQLARLKTIGARVVDVCVRPVYDGQPSGIRLRTVLHPILSLLLRSMARRLWMQHLSRSAPKLSRRQSGSVGYQVAGNNEDRSADHLLPAPRR